jgi:hypothetical protein
VPEARTSRVSAAEDNAPRLAAIRQSGERVVKRAIPRSRSHRGAPSLSLSSLSRSREGAVRGRRCANELEITGSHERTECTRFSVRSADVGWAHRRSRRPLAKPRGEQEDTRDLARTRLALRGDARGGTRRRANRCASMATRRLPRTEGHARTNARKPRRARARCGAGLGTREVLQVASAVGPIRRQGVRSVDVPPLNQGGVVALLARWFTGRGPHGQRSELATRRRKRVRRCCRATMDTQRSERFRRLLQS